MTEPALIYDALTVEAESLRTADIIVLPAGEFTVRFLAPILPSRAFPVRVHCTDPRGAAGCLSYALGSQVAVKRHRPSRE